MRIPQWFAIQTFEGKEEEIVAKVLTTLVASENEKIARLLHLGIKIPRDADGSVLFSGYVFLKTNLTPEVYYAVNSVPFYFTWIHKRRYTHFKKGWVEQLNAVAMSSHKSRDTQRILKETHSNEMILDLKLLPGIVLTIKQGQFKDCQCVFHEISQEGENPKAKVSITLLGTSVETDICLHDFYEEEIIK